MAGAVGLFGGEQTPDAGIDLAVPGPIVTVIAEWVGLDPAASGSSALEMTVTGPGLSDGGAVPGTLSATDDALGSPLFAWYADVTDLFGVGSAGAYNVDVEPFSSPGFLWGATVTVVYDTGPCEIESQLTWKVGADYYFGRSAAVESRTETMAYQFPASDVDRVAVLRASHGGADSNADSCRVSAIWAATGDGEAPGPGTDLVDGAGTPVLPGATEIAVAPFSPDAQGCPAPAPVSPLLSITGGNVGPEYALVEMELLVPAGATWVALQLESPPDNGGYPGLPESGAWAGGAVLLLDVPVVVPVASVVLEKTVLAGDAAVCPGVEGTDELVVDDAGSAVTYCYRVVNSGETSLLPVTLDDPSLGIADGDMALVSGDPSLPLPPGGELVYSFVTVIDGPLTGVAVTEGVPVDSARTPIPDLDPVSDSNDAGVDVPVVVPVASVVLEKTVLAGDAAVCPGVEGTDELVVDDAGSAVTYCYRVVNSGETSLLPVTLDDPSLGIADGDMALVSGDPSLPLPPGGELVYSFVTVIDGPLTGVAVTEGVPVDSAGTPIPDLDPVSDSNDAGVDVESSGSLPAPSITLEKTVLDPGGGCPGVEGTDELLVTMPDAPAQFCYRITNTGNTALTQITLDDPDIDVTEDDLVVEIGTLVSPLLAGEEVVATLPVEGVEGVSEAVVAGVPALDDGTPLGLDPVTAANDAGIVTVGVVLEKTVLDGRDAACPGVEASDEVVTTEVGSWVTFCFRVINTGTTHLFPVQIADSTLGITEGDMALVSGDPSLPLAPGGEIVFAYNHVVAVSMINVATATGVPTDATGGTVLAPPLVTSNDARVAVLQETLPFTGSSMVAQTWLGLTMLLLGAFVVVGLGIVEGRSEA